MKYSEVKITGLDEAILIPAHKRTIYVESWDWYDALQRNKYCLDIPQMIVGKNNPNESKYYPRYYYFPYVDNIQYYSPFLNTYSSGEICLSQYSGHGPPKFNLMEALNQIYNSVWHPSNVASGWRIYQITDVSFHRHFENWQKNGIKLIRTDK